MLPQRKIELVDDVTALPGSEAPNCLVGFSELMDHIASTNRRYRSEHVVFSEGDAAERIFLLTSGLVAIRKFQAGGRSVLLQLLHAGELFGLDALLPQGGYSATAEVVQPSQISSIDNTAARALTVRSPILASKLLELAIRRQCDAEDHLAKIATLSVRGRVAHQLLCLGGTPGTTEGRNGCHGFSVEFPLAWCEFAQMIGISPETLSRTKKIFSQEGIASFDGRMVVVPNAERLKRELEFG